MGAYIVSVDVPTEATTGQEICPGVVIGNNSSEAVAVGLSWKDEPGPSGLGDDESGYTDITILGPKGAGSHAQEKLYPSVRIMPAADANWGISIWKINEDGVTWSKVETRDFTIANVSQGGGSEEEGGMSTGMKWLIGGLVAVGALVTLGGLLLTRKK